MDSLLGIAVVVVQVEAGHVGEEFPCLPFLSQFGGTGTSIHDFMKPKGIAVDTLGNIYVIDAMFDNVQIFDADGRFLLNFGEAGSQPGEFWLPNGIAINRQNEIFVADSYNRRVQVFKYVGEL